MQNWKKLGLIYNADNYSSVPIGHFISKNIIRIFCSRRDAENQSTPFFIDYNLESIKILNKQVINLDLGDAGTFDENGIMPTSLIIINSKLYLYYIGWNSGGSTPFRNAIGLAMSFDNGLTFKKHSNGPILDRSIYDNCFVASNCVIKDNGIYKMYYLSCGEWLNNNGKLKHKYNIKYAESNDGINWKREGIVAIDFKYKHEYAISVPRVVKEDDIFKMWYSYRGIEESDSYRIGYAESNDGKVWNRKDDEIIFTGENESWDSKMMCYPFIYDYNKNRFMLYNGNEYGKSGIGLAILEK
tara:strand:+ start:1621 stop:2517 length:897 start_codon:yes stop_codon:yes gene_type:complete